MANGKTHLIAGVVVAGIANAAAQRRDPDSRFDWGELLAVSVVGGGLGLLADILEPATSPNHRKFFHSIFFVAIGLFAFTRFWNKEPRTDQERRTWPALLLAFLSHHFLDSLTKRGLPWLGFRLRW